MDGQSLVSVLFGGSFKYSIWVFVFLVSSFFVFFDSSIVFNASL